jgi:amino acid adenylation domain-containing protein/FkbM family methyltransferase
MAAGYGSKISMNQVWVPPVGHGAERDVTLPLSRPRSAAHWPHRDTVIAADSDALGRLVGLGAKQRLPMLAGAVAAVLARYCATDRLPIGILADDGTVRRIALSAADGATVRALIDGVADALEGMSVRLRDAESDAVPAVLVGEQSGEGTVSDLRQDVTVMLRVADAALAGIYNPRLFDKDVVQRFLAHVLFFLDAALKESATPIAEMDYLRPDEVAAIDAVTCPPAVPYPADATLQSLFRAAALGAPDAPAVEFGERRLTYRELDAQSDRVAAGLIAAGAKRGACVGVSVRPSAEQIIALLGVLKAGATPVPIDHTFPRQRLMPIVMASGLDLLVTEDSLMDAHGGLAKLIRIEELMQTEGPAPAVTGDGDDLVYVLFTSGSTGAPKGVAMRQRTLVNLVCWQNAQTPAAGKRTLNRSSMAFDVGFQEIFSTLCWGGTLVIASENDRADIARLQQLIGRQRIERIFVPPVALIQMAELSADAASEWASLRHVIAAGEQLRITPAIVRMFRGCPAVLTNQYGPTETHVATSYDLQGSSLKWPLRPSIGRPIANARVHILDRGGRRCPFGVKGEITIGGVLPAAGYLGDPENTRRRFVPDPFPGAPPAALMYRTGDVGRLLSDGTIEFVGRSDDQIKLRGYRIELSDIEANAMAEPGVQLAAAALRTRQNGDAFIALFLQIEPHSVFDVRAVRSFLLGRLPQHMVPGLGAIRAVERLPLNRNGKVDRARLPEFETLAGEEEEGAESRTLAERVAAIWKQHLHVDVVNPDDDFAALGGHSLIAIQIVSRTNDVFGISVPIAALLRGGSLGHFADKVAELVAAKHGHPAGPSAAGEPSLELAEFRSVTLADGRIVAAPYAAEAHHFFREVFERKVYFRHGIRLPPRGTVLDVGANIGLFALHAADQAGGDARVIAIEPAPALVSALKRNTVSLGERIKILDVGLGAHDGTAAFTFYPALTGMSSFFPDQSRDRQLLAGLIANERAADPSLDRALADDEQAYLDSRLDAQTFERPMRRLSSIIRALGLESIDLLKIDVQHGEDEILDGIDAGDWSKIRQVVVEYQNGNGTDSAIARRLAAQGFLVTTEQDALHSGTDVVYSYAIRP